MARTLRRCTTRIRRSPYPVLPDPLYPHLVWLRLSTGGGCSPLACPWCLLVLGRRCDGRGDGACMTPSYWKVASCCESRCCCWSRRQAAGYAARRLPAVKCLSLVSGVDLNEEARRPANLAPPAADGAHLALGASRASALLGGPERLRPQLPCGGTDRSRLQASWLEHPGHLLRRQGVRLRLRGRLSTATLSAFIGYCGSGGAIADGSLLQWLLVASPARPVAENLMTGRSGFASSKR